MVRAYPCLFYASPSNLIATMYVQTPMRITFLFFVAAAAVATVSGFTCFTGTADEQNGQEIASTWSYGTNRTCAAGVTTCAMEKWKWANNTAYRYELACGVNVAATCGSSPTRRRRRDKGGTTTAYKTGSTHTHTSPTPTFRLTHPLSPRLQCRNARLQDSEHPHRRRGFFNCPSQGRNGRRHRIMPGRCRLHFNVQDRQ
jgi:hypothetical protein